jgi:predicted Zn-dependent protease
MKPLSTFALALALVAGSATFAGPATAQKKQEAPKAAQPAAWAPKISKAEATALKAVETAIKQQDWATAATALAAAQPLVTSPDGRYYIGQFQYSIGEGTKNQQLQVQGLDAMLASGGGDPVRSLELYQRQADLALKANDYAKADAALARLTQLTPNDLNVQVALGQSKFRQKKPQEALPILERAIAARRTAGETVPEQWYLVALQSALDAKAAPQTLALSRAVVSAYPTPRNWRNALLLYRENNTLDEARKLDTFRLMQATKAFEHSDEYVGLADLLARGRFYAEAREVLEAGIGAGKVNRGGTDAAALLREISAKSAEDRAALTGLESRARSGANGDLALRLAEGFFGHKDYGKAVEYYRLALQKGGVDANLVNTRLGIALANAGQKAEAEAAFKAVTGPRAELASYWMLWLAQRG